MNKKLLILALSFLVVPTCSDASSAKTAKKPSAKIQPPHPQAGTMVLQALELAATLPTTLQHAFGTDVFDDFTEEATDAYYPLQEQILASSANILKTTNKSFKSIAGPIKELITLLYVTIPQSEKDDLDAHKKTFQKLMQTFYAAFITKLSMQKSKIKLLADPLPYFKIAPELLTTIANINFSHDHIQQKNREAQILTEIKNTTSLLWLEYINIFGNDPVQIMANLKETPQQKIPFPPLKWAYYTAHAGTDGFSPNNIFNHYSKATIEGLLGKVQEIAGKLSGRIEGFAKRPIPDQVANAEAFNTYTQAKEKFIDDAYKQLSEAYALLLQPKQRLNSFFKLRTEFQEAFPVAKRVGGVLSPELPALLDKTLTALANVWINLVAKNFITNETTAMLTFPQIIDMSSKKAVGISAETWIHGTAYAGYNSESENKAYQALLDSLKQNTLSEWIKKLPSKIAGIPGKIKDFLIDEEDDLGFDA